MDASIIFGSLFVVRKMKVFPRIIAIFPGSYGLLNTISISSS